ncbi:MAG: hypothetical protein FWD47_07080 [Treponema sp.]|nr:hypothetical protein [Treponema sp.]
MRAIFIPLIILLIYGGVSAQNRNSLDFLVSGEYAFYLDTRGENTFYRGYMYFTAEENQRIVFVRSVNANTGYEERFVFTVDDDENGFPTVITDLQGQYSDIECRQALPDFLNFTTLFIQTRNNYQLQRNIEDRWDNYTLVFSFNKILPFFAFYDIKIKNNNESKYKLLYGGFLDPGTLNAFFEMNPDNRQTTTVTRQVPDIPRRNSRTVEQNGVRITLDDNWQFNDNSELPGYWLSLDTIRDSQIAIERTNLRTIPILTRENYFMLYKFLILESGRRIEMDTLSFSQTRMGYQLEYYIVERNQRNYTRQVLTLNRDDLIIINFSTFADIYDKNKNYYNRIFNSITVNR